LQYTYKHTLYACYLGYITQAIVNNLAPVLFVIFQQEFNISFEMIGRLIMINFMTQIAVDFISVKYVDKIGYRKAVVAAHVFCVLGLVCLGTLPQLLPLPYAGLVISVIIYAIGGGIIEVLISPIVDSLPGEAKASAMSLLHSFYCWGQMGVVIISTLFLKIFGSNTWFLLPFIWALIPLYNLFNFLKVPLMPVLSEKEKTPVFQLLGSKVYIIALLLMLSAGASELAMSQWSSLFAEKGLKVPKFAGDLLGPCLFAAFMGIGRTVYGIWGHKINLRTVLKMSGILCIACYMITAFSSVPAISLVGCSVCGLAVSLMWPGTLSLTAEHYPKGGTALFGILAIFGDVGASVGPWLVGFVSDLAQRHQKLLDFGERHALEPEQLGLKSGLLIAVVFPLILFIGILLLRTKKNEKQDYQNI